MYGAHGHIQGLGFQGLEFRMYTSQYLAGNEGRAQWGIVWALLQGAPPPIGTDHQ